MRHILNEIAPNQYFSEWFIWNRFSLRISTSEVYTFLKIGLHTVSFQAVQSMLHSVTIEQFPGTWFFFQQPDELRGSATELLSGRFQIQFTVENSIQTFCKERRKIDMPGIDGNPFVSAS